MAGIYAFTSALGKLAILHSAPAFFGVVYPLAFSGVMLTGYPLSNPRPGAVLGARYRWGMIMGVFLAGSIFCHVYGMSLAPATY